MKVSLFIWQRVKNRLAQSDTWLIVAVLALVLWTIDALQMFLEMHQSFAAGLGAFASHFWYAVPVTMAVVVLSRLRPHAELLGLTVYDETGQVVQQQGSFHLDEFAAKGMQVALKDHPQHGLQRLTLPSGARLYFLEDGGFTWVLCFSGSATPRDLDVGIHRFQPERPPAHFDLLFGLDPATAALAANLLSSPVKRSVLAFMHRFKLTAVQVEDLAYQLGQSEEDVTRALDDFVTLELVQVQCVCEYTFYRLNRDPSVQAKLDVLFAWQAKWQLQVQRLDSMLRLN
jgi:hypothetical protein